MYAEDAYIDEKEAARLTKLSVPWFRRARVTGDGPPFAKIGAGRRGAVRYKKSTLLAWFDARTIANTSQEPPEPPAA